MTNAHRTGHSLFQYITLCYIIPQLAKVDNLLSRETGRGNLTIPFFVVYYTLVMYIGGECMPVYEYRCDECGEKFELFVRSTTRKTAPTCPKCGSHKARKDISLFGIGGASGGSKANAASCGPGPV
ncbi:MAG: zinc ribbon domain-containing protein [Chloroflexota bacterium]|nr:zinc ribbon domain-containing protein [Chloroflexota bacterium]